MRVSRRQFVRSAAVGSAFLGLRRVLDAQAGGGRAGGAAAPNVQPYLNEVEGYGPLVPDPRQIMDLPEGFRYRILTRTGDAMADGLRVPAMPDGMAAFPAPDGRVILVRNHELAALRPPHEGPYGVEFELLSRVAREDIYDFANGRPHFGGTTTLVYDPAGGRVERQFLSLAGTLRNCAGGQTPWRSWISCEESVDVAGEVSEQHHGYAFEVPATTTPGLAPPLPLKAMGRFYREAVAIDPRTSIVYQTEDRNDGLIYRFVPRTGGRLAAGGRLQALAVRDRRTLDTRNWAETGAPKIAVGERLPVHWVDLDHVDAPEDDLRVRGAARGAALFARGEGMWFGRNEVYFACTNGGVSQRSQIFRYVPSPAEGTSGEDATPGTLALYLEPNNAHVLESCDNVSIAPWGDLILCEDEAGPASVVARYGVYNFLRGVTPEGRIYTIARNRYPGGSELSGVCFAPDHPTMFVNIQTAGLTLAITGPWRERRG